MAERLIYYVLEPDRETGSLRSYEHAEFKVFYTTPNAAKRAGDAVLMRLLDEFRAKIAAHDPMVEATSAKKLWDDEKKSACFVETRIVTTNISWNEGGRHGAEWNGTLLVSTESRHRWRDVVMKMVVAKNGVATCTYTFGKPLPWSKWRSNHGFDSGGPYIPSHTVLTIRAVSLPFAATRDELVAWARGGEVKADA